MRPATARAFSSLDDLATYHEWLSDELLEAEGVLTPEMERRLDQLNGDIRQKVERIGLFILELEAQAAAIGAIEKRHSDRLRDRRRGKERAAAKLKAYLEHQLQRLGERRVDGLLCTVTLHRNSAPTIVATTPAGPQNDLFAPKDPKKASQSNRRDRGQHVRIR